MIMEILIRKFIYNLLTNNKLCQLRDLYANPAKLMQTGDIMFTRKAILDRKRKRYLFPGQKHPNITLQLNRANRREYYLQI